jgi:Bacterial regulatory proteins, luxR family
MSERADAGLVNWRNLAVNGLLPTGTVTLLLANVEGSARLWESRPEEMASASAARHRSGIDAVNHATRLFVSPRTVQTHVTHVYTRLGLTSRVQLAQDAARHA